MPNTRTTNPGPESRPPRQGATTRPAAAEPPTGFSAPQSDRLPETRKEPSFRGGSAGAEAHEDTEHNTHPFAGSAYAQSAKQSPWYQQTGPLHRNPVSRVMLMAGIFVVGAAVGLGATWWMSKSGADVAAKPAIKKLQPAAQAPTSKASNHAGAGSAATINPGELPYDGRTSGGSSVGQAPAAIAQPPAAKVESSPLPPAAEVPPNASRTNREPDGPATPVVKAPPPVPKKAEQEIAEVPSNTGNKTAPATKAKVRETKVAKAPQRSRTPQKVAKDREIERIQQQADDELKKKSRSGDVTEAARSRTESAEKKPTRQANDDPPPAVAQGSKRAALARCEVQEDSLIGRELCKWKVCNGMWGKNGCPAYEKRVSTY